MSSTSTKAAVAAAAASADSPPAPKAVENSSLNKDLGISASDLPLKEPRGEIEGQKYSSPSYNRDYTQIAIDRGEIPSGGSGIPAPEARVSAKQ